VCVVGGVWCVVPVVGVQVVCVVVWGQCGPGVCNRVGCKRNRNKRGRWGVGACVAAGRV